VDTVVRVCVETDKTPERARVGYNCGTNERTNERTKGGRARGGPNRRRSTSGSTLGRADAAVEVEEELAVGGGAGDVGGPSILDEVREELRLAGMTLGDDGES